MDMHDKMNAAVQQRTEHQEANLLEESKKRLLRIISKKLRTTFIGDISAMEEAFGILWGHKKLSGLTAEEKKYKKLWDGVRNKILNNGNNQLRAIENELQQYTTTWDRYHTQMEVIKENGQETDCE